MIAVKCPSCGTLFGYEDKGVLNIKHRDLFRQVRGSVKGPCRRCGAEVTWPGEQDSVNDESDSGTR